MPPLRLAETTSGFSTIPLLILFFLVVLRNGLEAPSLLGVGPTPIHWPSSTWTNLFFFPVDLFIQTFIYSTMSPWCLYHGLWYNIYLFIFFLLKSSVPSHWDTRHWSALTHDSPLEFLCVPAHSFTLRYYKIPKLICCVEMASSSISPKITKSSSLRI